MNTDTWILVCDSSRARLFARPDGQPRLTLVRELAHPESRLPNHELASDRPGRVQQSAPPPRGKPTTGPSKGNRSGMEPHTAPKTVEHEHFARELADALHKGLTDNAYGRLVLVGAPQFLGLLRNVLDAQVSKRVGASLDKDYTQLDERELGERLQPLLG